MNTLIVDWNSVKKQTLWCYEDLIAKLQDTLGYAFVQEHYNHTMPLAREYAIRIRQGYLQNQEGKTGFIDEILANLEKLETRKIGAYSDLIHQITTREECLAFIQQTGFEFDPLIQTLNYLFRWVLPFKIPVREFVDPDNDLERKYLDAVKNLKLGSNLDLLETCRFELGRVRLASNTGIPLGYVISLVHKADISRLAYVRGKTVRHLCGGGYDTLEKIAAATSPEMEEKMDAYFRMIGKSSADFKAVIPLAWMIGGARTLPEVVKM